MDKYKAMALVFGGFSAGMAYTIGCATQGGIGMSLPGVDSAQAALAAGKPAGAAFYPAVRERDLRGRRAEAADDGDRLVERVREPTADARRGFCVVLRGDR